MFDELDFWGDEPRWTTQEEIERDVRKAVSKYLIRRVIIVENYTPLSFQVEVQLRWWTWIFAGRMHRKVEEELQARCDKGRPAAVPGTVIVPRLFHPRKGR